MPTDDFAQLQLQLVDQTQWRYEVIRPLVLFVDRTPCQRAHETDTHPAPMRTLTRRFQRQGVLGLLPEDVEVSIRARTRRVPETVREELDRLKALYDGLRYRGLARILFITCGVSSDHKTVKALWQASAVSRQGHLGLWDYHAQPDRYQARMQVITLYYQGWEKNQHSPVLACVPLYHRCMDPALRGGPLRRTGGQEFGAPRAGAQGLAAADGAGVPPAEGASGCRTVPYLEPAGAV